MGPAIRHLYIGSYKVLYLISIKFYPYLEFTVLNTVGFWVFLYFFLHITKGEDMSQFMPAPFLANYTLS